MKTLTMLALCFVGIVAAALFLAGCRDPFMRLAGKTFFGVTTVRGGDETPFTSTLVSLLGQRIAIVSDCPRQSSDPHAPRRVSGVHVAAGGHQIPWVCETLDTRTISRVSVNGIKYRFLDGNTFLISSKGNEIRVLQLQIADNKVLSLEELCKDNAEAKNFFAQSAARKKHP